MFQRGAVVKRRARPAAAPAAAGLAVIALVAAGVAVGAVVLRPEPPASATAEDGPRTTPVSTEIHDGARQVSVTARTGDPIDLVVADAGRVTHSACAPGETLRSGQSPLSLDARPVLALATDTPLYRDLAVGSRGADVTALQTELARLGHAVQPDGIFGSGTRAAVRATLTDIGVDRPTGALTVSSVLWLPEPEVTVTACEVQVGDRFDGGTVATVGGGLVALEVGGTDPVDGREVRWHEHSAPIGQDRLVTDPAFLAALAESPLLPASTADADSTPIELTTALAEPIEVAVVPPSAVFELVGTTGCVVDDAGAPHHVTVVASALGQTLVHIDGDIPEQVRVDRDAAQACR